MFPFDATEWEDLDFDGTGNNADTDDDGDSWSDLDEPNCGTDPLDANSYPDDFDADRICDPLDPDDDNDMTLDINDAFPFDPGETKDTDGDGTGDNSDTDDDGDDWPDSVEALCQTEPLSSTSVPIDTDGDGSCDVIDADDDNDDVGDLNDVFPLDSTEWEDRNGDGLGDNANPLSLVDHMKLNPLMTALIVLVILAAIAGSVAFTMGRRKGRSDESWKDDDYRSYSEPMAESEVPEPPEPPQMPPEPPQMPPEAPLEEVESEPDVEEEAAIPPPPPMPAKRAPPPPPGFEDAVSGTPSPPTRVDSWEDLPDGGDYVQTEPMQYVGEECGVWIRQDDDSWVMQQP